MHMHAKEALPDAGLLHLSIDTWCWVLLCGGGLPVLYGMLSSTLDLCQLVASSNSHTHPG